MLRQTSLLESFVGGVLGLDVVVYGECPFRNRGNPDFVITLTLAQKFAPGLEKQFLQITGVTADAAAW
jgi:hypothetical protein